MRVKSIFVIILVIGMAAINSRATTLSEDFDDGLTPEYWEIFQNDAVGSPWSILVPDEEGRLAISKSADNDSSTAYQTIDAGITSKFVADGDFSVFVDFDLIVYPLSNRHGYNEAWITALSYTTGSSFSSLLYATSSRKRAEAWANLQSGGLPLGAITENSTQGKLGVTRTGDTMSAWIDRGSGPILLASLSSTEFLGPIKFQVFGAQVPSPNLDRPSTELDIRFDNFLVTAETVVPEPATLLLLGFGSIALRKRKQ